MTPPPDSSASDAAKAFGDTGGASPFGDAGAAAAFGDRGDPGEPRTPAGRRRKAHGPRRERWIPALIAVLALGGTGLVLWQAERSALEDPVQQGRRGEVVGVSGRSLLAGDALRRALVLAGARLEPGDVVTGLRISPVVVSVAARDAVGRARNVDVDLALDTTLSSPGANASAGVPLGTIDPAAPERFVRAVLARGPFDEAALDDVTWRYAAGAERPQSWALTLDGVPIPDQNWVAEADGGDVRRASDPTPVRPAPTPPEPAARPRPTAPARPGRRPSLQTNAVTIQVGGTTIITDPRSARRLRACLRRAGGSATRQRACVNAL